MNIRSFLLGIGIAAVVSAGASSSQATTVYDTISGGSYSSGGWTIGTINFGNSTYSYTAAVQFTPTVTGYIDSLKLSLFGGSSGVVQIFSNAAGLLGSSLGSLALNESPTYGTFASGTYASGVTLNQGTSYWIVATSANPSQAWYYMNLGSPRSVVNYLAQGPGNQALVTTGTYNSYNSSTALGLTVDIAPAPTPLPASLPLLATGLGAMCFLAWRGKKKRSAAPARSPGLPALDVRC